MKQLITLCVIIFITRTTTSTLLQKSINDVTVDNEGRYAGLTIAIQENMNELQCEAIVNSLINLINSSSHYLLTVTNKRLSFNSAVDIVVPNSWSSACGQYTVTDSIRKTLDDAPIRVGLQHSLFGNEVWTQQSGHCKVPGDYMYLPQSWLQTNNHQGRRFVQEWAKLRWGVFDEHGFSGDVIYPPAFINDDNIITPNYCSDQPLVADMSSCDDEVHCNVNIDETDNLDVTSSLMAFKQLHHVNNFCDSSTHKDTPTKHQVLCEGKSVTDVMMEHSDFNRTTETTAPTSIQPRLLFSSRIQPSSVVFAIDNSRKMNTNHDMFNFLKDALKQLIVNEMDDSTLVSLLTFSPSVAILAERKLVKDNKPDLISAIDGITTVVSESEKTLEGAIKQAASMLNTNEEGVIMLITENMVSYSANEDIDTLLAATGGHRLDILLYPNKHDLDTDLYQSLAGNTTGVFNKVDTKLSIDNQDPVNRLQLSDVFRINYSLATPFIKIGEDKCLGAEVCQISEITIDASYSSVQAILYYSSDIPLQATVTTSSGDICDKLDLGTDSSQGFNCYNVQSGNIRIQARRGRPDDDVYYEVIGVPNEPEDSDVKVWFSQQHNNLKYTSEVAPTIHAYVLHKNRPVVRAAVSVTMTSPMFTGTEYSLMLNDKGTGGDVTGQDGVYSAYLLNLPKSFTGHLLLQVNANDASRAAKYLPNTAVATIECCGSSLQLSEGLDSTGVFNITSELVRAQVIVGPGVYPPSPVTDLKITNNVEVVTLAFTATGAELDYGTCTSYIVQYYTGSGDLQTINNLNEITPGSSGSQESIDFKSPVCDSLITFTVTSQSGNKTSKPSNSVSKYIPCNISNSNLSAGAVTGIVLGCILGILIIILLICLFATRKDKKDSKVWHYTLCKCCSKKDSSKSPQTSNSKSNYQRQTRPVQIIKDISDLYNSPSNSRRHDRHQNQGYINSDSEDDDGGFRARGDKTRQLNHYISEPGHHVPSNNHMQSNYPVTHEQHYTHSTASSMSEMSHKNGLPSHVRSSFDYYPSYHATPRPVIEEPSQLRKNNYQADFQPNYLTNNSYQRFNTQV